MNVKLIVPEVSLQKIFDLLPCNLGRSSLIHSLLESYGLLTNSHELKLDCDDEIEELMLSFHSQEYLDTLKAEQLNESFGLVDDCSPFPNLWKYCLATCKGTIEACELICSGICNVAIFIDGGRHHARREKASGYCYVNDIVLGIERLKMSFDKILYIDLDLHHGDAVQDAFYCSKRVFTFSLHKYQSGFYPNSGSLADIGAGNGKWYNFNAPLKDGFGGISMINFISNALRIIINAYKPNAIFIQLGLDTLPFDPFQSFNYSISSIEEVVLFILNNFQLPTVIVGGGGYNHSNVARCWTRLLAKLTKTTIEMDIKSEYRFINEFGPNYSLELEHSNVKNCNSEEYLQDILKELEQNVANI